MKERLIIFSAPMVQAILEGRKTQTRSIVKFPDGLTTHDDWLEAHEIAPAEYVFWSGPKHVNPDFTRSVYKPGDGILCPYGQPGDRLWASVSSAENHLLLEITDVRVERLHEITEEDAIAEGEKPDVFLGDTPTAIVAFALRWDDVYGPGAYASNPWVWVITFKKIQP